MIKLKPYQKDWITAFISVIALGLFVYTCLILLKIGFTASTFQDYKSRFILIYLLILGLSFHNKYLSRKK